MCPNDRGISLVKSLIAPGKYTFDQVFTLHQILEKTHEKQVEHNIFLSTMRQLSIPHKGLWFSAMSELGISSKLTRIS